MRSSQHFGYRVKNGASAPFLLPAVGEAAIMEVLEADTCHDDFINHDLPGYEVLLQPICRCATLYNSGTAPQSAMSAAR